MGSRHDDDDDHGGGGGGDGTYDFAGSETLREGIPSTRVPQCLL